MYTTLIDVQSVAEHIHDPNWVVVDCRFDLADTTAGSQAYQIAHIPTAVYAHLDDDLCGPPVTDHGRHPLPTPQKLRDTFGRLGIQSGEQVVVYDDNNGAYASRLWWMLRYMGHQAVAVLDGGWQAWIEAGQPTKRGEERAEAVSFKGAPKTEWLVRLEEVAEVALLVDSRGPERHRGEIEPHDPVAGHIPGSINHYYRENWDSNGRYLSADQIRARLKPLLGDTPADDVTFYCGSGVTACVNLLALAHSGLGNGRLYVGSWSEWSRHPELPIAAG